MDVNDLKENYINTILIQEHTLVYIPFVTFVTTLKDVTLLHEVCDKIVETVKRLFNSKFKITHNSLIMSNIYVFTDKEFKYNIKIANFDNASFVIDSLYIHKQTTDADELYDIKFLIEDVNSSSELSDELKTQVSNMLIKPSMWRLEYEL